MPSTNRCRIRNHCCLHFLEVVPSESNGQSSSAYTVDPTKNRMPGSGVLVWRNWHNRHLTLRCQSFGKEFLLAMLPPVFCFAFSIAGTIKPQSRVVPFPWDNCGLFFLQLSNALQARVAMPGALQSESLRRLEKAILFFLQSFRKVHIGESSMPCSKVQSSPCAVWEIRLVGGFCFQCCSFLCCYPRVSSNLMMSALSVHYAQVSR